MLNLNGAAIYQGGDALPTGNSPRTLEFWVRQGNYMGTNVSYGDFGATLYVSGGSEVDVGTLRAPTGFPFGGSSSWNQIAVTWDGSTAVVYVDGVQTGSSALSAFNTQEPGSPLEVSGPNSFAVDFGELAVYPTALSASRIAAGRGVSEGGGGVTDWEDGPGAVLIGNVQGRFGAYPPQVRRAAPPGTRPVRVGLLSNRWLRIVVPSPRYAT